MAQTNTIFFGWNRALPGREGMAAELFAHAVSYYTKLQSTGQITSWEPVFLNRHGGDLNGFFLIKGDHAKLDAVLSSEEWMDLTLRADMYLTGVGVIEGWTGAVVPELMQTWTKLIPQK